MGTDIHDLAAVQTRLWNEIEKHQIGMLGLVGAATRPFQPMTAFLDRAANQLWFFSYNDTPLAAAAASGAGAMFVFQEGRWLYACVTGEVRAEHDRARMDRYWNATVAAWYPGGKHDSRLTLLRLDARDAEVWVSETGPARFAWEIAKANATRSQPDLGGHTHLTFH